MATVAARARATNAALRNSDIGPERRQRSRRAPMDDDVKMMDDLPDGWTKKAVYLEVAVAMGRSGLPLSKLSEEQQIVDNLGQSAAYQRPPERRVSEHRARNER